MADELIYRSVKQLAQARPSGTSAVSAYACPAATQAVVTTIIICNTTGSNVNASIYVDVDGTTYDATTAIMMASVVAANTMLMIEFANGLPMNKNTAGNIAVQSSTGNALTFTINGIAS